MKQQNKFTELFKFLSDQNICLNTGQKDWLVYYYEQLIAWNKRLNLISKNDASFIIENHFIPGFYFVYLLKKYSIGPRQRIMDLGTGAGLPGIIISICLHTNPVILLDSSRKKTLFVRKMIDTFEVNAHVVCERVEQLALGENQKFDIVAARAVGSIEKLVKWSRPLLKPNGFLLLIKGNYYMQNEKLAADKYKITEEAVDLSWINRYPYLENKIFLKVEF